MFSMGGSYYFGQQSTELGDSVRQFTCILCNLFMYHYSNKRTYTGEEADKGGYVKACHLVTSHKNGC